MIALTIFLLCLFSNQSSSLLNHPFIRSASSSALVKSPACARVLARVRLDARLVEAFPGSRAYTPARARVRFYPKKCAHTRSLMALYVRAREQTLVLRYERARVRVAS